MELARTQEQIVTWFRAHGRSLPWRDHSPGPWGMLLVEVMSAQTPIMRVVPVWEEWIKRWPTPADLAAAEPNEVIRAWGRLGYPRRALYLRDAAAKIVNTYGGVVPRGETELLSLPGVGPYTAAAVSAFAYGQRAVVLDTNIRRVLTRIRDGRALPPVHLTKAERERAEQWVPISASAATEWNAAVMEFGALICTAKAPLCEQCPVTQCAWREAGYPQNAPARKAQGWAGTIRQLRGEILALAREAEDGVSRSAVFSHLQAVHSWAQESEVERALGALLADELLAEEQEHYRLP